MLDTGELDMRQAGYETNWTLTRLDTDELDFIKLDFFAIYLLERYVCYQSVSSCVYVQTCLVYLLLMS